MNRQPSFVLFGAAALTGFAAVWILSIPLALARGQGQPAVQANADTQICPLSDKQLQQSQQTFAAMMPTFTHPRCINCHGAANPFAPNTTHVGGRIGTKFIEIVRHDDILDRDIKLVVPDLEDPDALFRSCQDCHSAFPGWKMPTPAKWFVGKDSNQLCRQMKREFPGPSAFVDHLEHDINLPFIVEAFRGTRGLDTNGQAIYLNETGQDFKPEPPPISHAAFIGQGRAWLEAMGVHDANTLKGGDTCGCQPHHYVFQGGGDMVWLRENDKTWIQGHVDLKIPITFNDDGSFSGQTAVDSTLTGTIDSGVMICDFKLEYTGQIWKVSGNIDASGEMRSTLTTFSSPTELISICTTTGGTIKSSLPNNGGEWSTEEARNYVSVGDKIKFESKKEGGTLTSELMVVEEGQ